MPKKKLYSPNQNELFQISRSNIQSFLECPRCFYLQTIKGIKHPSGLPLPINMAIDSILKKEFDYYREKIIPHHILLSNNYNMCCSRILISPIYFYKNHETTR